MRETLSFVAAPQNVPADSRATFSLPPSPLSTLMQGPAATPQSRRLLLLFLPHNHSSERCHSPHNDSSRYALRQLVASQRGVIYASLSLAGPLPRRRLEDAYRRIHGIAHLTFSPLRPTLTSGLPKPAERLAGPSSS